MHVIFLKTALYQGFFVPFIIDKTLFLLYVLLVFKGLRFGFAGKSMVESKNLKLKLGLCGLALTSFLALNSRSVVHADTVSGSNAGAITWDSDQDDSQVVKKDSQQEKLTQSVQIQGAVQSAPATQSVQSNVQKRAETSAVRVSNFDTSTVNRLNANSVRNNQVKVATVHDTAQMPVQKQKVAQFNQSSKIYTLNGSNQLSKNNGDGYVITNAGTYNGHAVDIGVTINNVNEQQGSYTTKWSNGDKADVTGKTNASFKYNNSVLVGTQQDNVAVLNQTKQHNVTTTSELPFQFIVHSRNGLGTLLNYKPDINVTSVFVDYYNVGKNIHDAFYEAMNYGINDLVSRSSIPASVLNDSIYNHEKDLDYPFNVKNRNLNSIESFIKSAVKDNNQVYSLGTIDYGAVSTQDFGFDFNVVNHPLSKNHDYDPNEDGSAEVETTTNVIDHLQLANKTNANLNYNYTVGLYDAQTGDLITDLKAEYKGKTGAQATASTNVMNSAIKNKIQQINQNKATVSYTGTKANDDVAFYEETRQVNPQDKNVNRQVQRVIHINFPNGVKPKSYDNITDSAGNKLTLDSNNNLTQSMSFTRTGVQNIVSGHVTYGNWQQHGAINAVTLPAIPGYTMTQTK